MIKYFILGLIKTYQIFLSPFLGKHCRFYPSCSQYTSLAVKRYGLCQGLYLGVKRLLRCHPFNAGGVDLP